MFAKERIAIRLTAAPESPFELLSGNAYAKENGNFTRIMVANGMKMAKTLRDEYVSISEFTKHWKIIKYFACHFDFLLHDQRNAQGS